MGGWVFGSAAIARRRGRTHAGAMQSSWPEPSTIVGGAGADGRPRGRLLRDAAGCRRPHRGAAVAKRGGWAAPGGGGGGAGGGAGGGGGGAGRAPGGPAPPPPPASTSATPATCSADG